MNELINQAMPLFTMFILSVIALVLQKVGKTVIEFLSAKKEEAIVRLGKEEYNRQLDIAFDIWGVVDEHFRLNDLVSHTIDDKANYFNDLLLERIPTLAQADLDYLRQVVAGIINEGREKLSIQ